YLGMEGQVNETLAIVRRVEELFDDVAAYQLLAKLQELSGNIDQAIAWTIRVRDLEPGNPLHIGKLAELYTDIGDFDTALLIEPEPSVGLLFKMHRYPELIDDAEILMIMEPEDVMLRYLLAFAYNATGQFDSAIWVLRSTGLPDSVINRRPLATDLEGYMTLVNAVYGAGESEVADELVGWWVAYGIDKPPNLDWWSNTYMACALAVLGRDAEALQYLQNSVRSSRPAWDPLLRDSTCFQRYSDEPIYQAVIKHFDDQRSKLRARLPLTLAESSVTLWEPQSLPEK
ncbi:MAG: hypothetical protein ACE1Y4_12590, partial [Lysobacterales bacterium]